MESDYRTKKIIAIISSSLPSGKAMNALGHLAFGAGHRAPDSFMGNESILDADGGTHLGISRHPLIVLQASNEDIKTIITTAKQQGLFVIDFSQEMFDTGPDPELVEALSRAHSPDILYHGALLMGETSALESLTKGLKLYR